SPTRLPANPYQVRRARRPLSQRRFAYPDCSSRPWLACRFLSLLRPPTARFRPGGFEMRVTALLLVSVLFAWAPAFAQDWDQFTFKDDGFKVDFPGPPKIAESTFKSEYGADIPARVYTVDKGREHYKVTVADYTQAPRLL